VYGPGGAQPTDFAFAAPSSWHRTTAANLDRTPQLRLAERTLTKGQGGDGLGTNGLCIAAGGEIVWSGQP
jgi:hypothetical protein